MKYKDNMFFERFMVSIVMACQILLYIKELDMLIDTACMFHNKNVVLYLVVMNNKYVFKLTFVTFLLTDCKWRLILFNVTCLFNIIIIHL